VLNAGANQTLRVHFVPSDTIDFSTPRRCRHRDHGEPGQPDRDLSVPSSPHLRRCLPLWSARPPIRAAGSFTAAGQCTLVDNGTGSATITITAAGTCTVIPVRVGTRLAGRAECPAILQAASKRRRIPRCISTSNPALAGQSWCCRRREQQRGHALGQCAFYDGSTLLGAHAQHRTGVAERAGLGGGSHDLTAVYGGDANYLSRTAPLHQVVLG